VNRSRTQLFELVLGGIVVLEHLVPYKHEEPHTHDEIPYSLPVLTSTPIAASGVWPGWPG